MLYVGFSCKNSSIRGKVTLYPLGKRTSKKNGSQELEPRRRGMFKEVRTEETLSLNALRVIYSVFLCDI